MSPKGARLRPMQMGFGSLFGRKEGTRLLPLALEGAEGGQSGDVAAEVVLPSELLQAKLVGADGSEATVQAESAYMRDLIVCGFRRFAGKEHYVVPPPLQEALPTPTPPASVSNAVTPTRLMRNGHA